ncbi:MAG: carbohydrate kinase family protein [Chloroflexi bacterium]|nr:carbohydrate kinase family protein [Chloroflexota bacterium]
MPTYLFLGPLNREYILPPQGKPLLDVPGGEVLYAAAGAALWGAEVGLISRVGEDFPQTWLDDLAARGWDVRGVRRLPEPLETRRVLVYEPSGRLSPQSPLAAFARRGITFPKSLLNYNPPPVQRANLDKPTPTSLRISDLPPNFGDARAAHFCPHDFLTHSLLPAALRTAGVPIITLAPHSAYMTALFYDRLPALLTGLTAFIVTEAQLRAVFRERTSDLWEMAETLGQWQVRYVVIRRAEGEVWLYDVNGNRRWVVPGYPTRMVDPTGADDAFAGGFLVGYRETLDPVQAVVQGAVSASLAVETRGALALLDTLPALVSRRAEVVSASVQQV